MYVATLDTIGATTQVVSLTASGPPPGLLGALPLAGALVTYPDGSTQLSDVLGNFDASQSSWAVANAAALAADPTIEPLVVVASGLDGITPVIAFVDAYEPSGPLVPGSAARQIMRVPVPQGTTPPALAGLTVTPASVSLFDVETREFHAVGADSSGARIGLGNVPVTWSLGKAAGCSPAAPAGSLKPIGSDQSKIRYVPPTSGSATSGCGDRVIASVTVAAGTLSASGVAVYSDHKASVKVSGTLVDGSGKGIAGALLDFGKSNDVRIIASTGSGGTFSVSAPSGATLSPVAGVRTGSGASAKLVYYPVSPASIQVPAAGLSGLKLTANIVTPTAKPSESPKPKPSLLPTPSPTPRSSDTPKPAPSATPTPAASSSPRS